MADVKIGDTADITITDNVSLTAALDVDDNSLLAKAGLKQMVSHTAVFVGHINDPVDQAGFTSATFGGEFSAPAQLLNKATKITVKSDVTGQFSAHTHADGKLFGQKRLMGWLSANAIAGHPASELRDRLAAELNRFRGSAPMDDDQAFLLLTEAAVGAARSGGSRAQHIQFRRGQFLFPASA